MIVIVAGMPRAGSMWTYNICRGLLSRDGFGVLPKETPPDETPLLDKMRSIELGPKQAFCIKTHKYIRPGVPRVKLICNYRDVREAMLSFMRFTQCDFDQTLQAVRGMMQITDFYFQEYGTNIVRVRYNDVISQPQKVAREICTFLELNLTSEQQDSVIDEFSLEKNRQRTKDIASRSAASGSSGDESEQPGIIQVRNRDGSYRNYDMNTGFQEGHITGQGQAWKTELNEEQQAQLNAIAKEWLVRYGFSVT